MAHGVHKEEKAEKDSFERKEADTIEVPKE